MDTGTGVGHGMGVEIARSQWHGMQRMGFYLFIFLTFPPLASSTVALDGLGGHVA